MKKSYILFLFVFCFKSQLFSQTPKVYINLNSHNEASGTSTVVGQGELDYDNATQRKYYDTAFKYIKQVSDMVVAKNVKYNFQSDVKFLFGCLKWDLKGSSTSCKNLLKWMDDLSNIECDPHSHEAKYPSFGAFGKIYNYADVAHLHDSLGVTNRKNVGGFKVDGLQNQTNWSTMEAGLQGKAYSTSGMWQPNVLWGGSYKAGVHYDMNFFGSFKPTLDTNNYATYSSNVNQRLRIQGNGCSMVFHDTTNEQRLIREYRKLFSNVHYGVYSPNEFYTPVLQINCRDIYKANYVSRLTKIIDSINTYVTLGWVEWRTIYEKDSIWRSVKYNTANKRTDCSALPTGIDEKYIQNALAIYPNPVSDILIVAHTIEIKSVTLIDALGKINFYESNIKSERREVNTESLNPGLYFVSVTLNDDKTVTRKFLKE